VITGFYLKTLNVRKLKMKASAIHKGETMHATLSFAYPDDEQKLKDALAGEKYRHALEEILEIIEDDATMSFKLTAIKTQLTIAFEETL
jgi:hypothetical protein